MSSPTEQITTSKFDQLARCKVCGASSNMYKFGMFCCRACCVFFRRAILNKRQYQCRWKSNCQITTENSRIMCRACRLEKCFSLGMRAEDILQNSCSPADSNEILPSHIPSINNADCYSKPVGLPAIDNEVFRQRYPTLYKVQSVFQSIYRTQRSLFAIEKPETVYQMDIQPQLITDTVFDRMEAGTLSLIASLLTEYLDYLLSLNLQPSYRLSKDQKAECISACVVDRYSILHKLFLTSDYLQKKKQNSANGLEQQEENVFVTHFGSMLIVDNLDLFFDDNATPKEIEEKTLNYSPICCSLKESADQMHTLKVRELEAAILGIILLWNQSVFDVEFNRASDSDISDVEYLREDLDSDYEDDEIVFLSKNQAPCNETKKIYEMKQKLQQKAMGEAKSENYKCQLGKHSVNHDVILICERCGRKTCANHSVMKGFCYDCKDSGFPEHKKPKEIIQPASRITRAHPATPIKGRCEICQKIDRVMTKMRASKEAQTIHLQPLISFLKQQKKLFYSEFHNNLCENYGTHNAGLRLIELMNILAGLSELENSYKEKDMITKIFIEQCTIRK